MKNKSLFKKSMVLIIVPIIIVSVLLLLVSKSVIEGYFREDSYKSLQRELNSIDKTAKIAVVLNDVNATGTPPRKPVEQELKWSPSLVPKKSVQTSFVIRVKENEFRVFGDSNSVEQFKLEQLLDNDEWPLQGESILASEKIFYSINPVNNKEANRLSNVPPNAEIYHIAYISESYSGDLSKVVLKVFIVGLSFLLLVVCLILFFVFKHMTKRLRILEEGASAIGKRNFTTHLDVKPYDEIGRLGDAMNRMSRQLELVQEEETDQFQMISHELKTPIMVMQGYMDALVHEQYPNGTKEATYQILNDELYKLEKLTQDIIILNKIEYLSKNIVEMTNISLRQLFEEASERMNIDDVIAIEVKGEMTLLGDLESWQRVVENLLSNNLRYAVNKIEIDIAEDIRINNDGPPIEEHLLSKIKKPFIKGKSGRSGLGLTIVNNILKLYHFNLILQNTDYGVEYVITKSNIPLS